MFFGTWAYFCGQKRQSTFLILVYYFLVKSFADAAGNTRRSKVNEKNRVAILIISSLSLLLITIPALAQNDSTPAGTPKMIIVKTTYDFGEIFQGEKAAYKFQIKNGGDGLLKLQDIQSTCGCTVANPEKSIIEPGEKVSLEVAFNSSGRSGKQKKRITISTNDPNNSKAYLTIQGTIITELTFSPSRLNYKDVSPGDQSETLITVKNTGRRNLVLEKITAGSKQIQVSSSSGKPLPLPVSLAVGESIDLQVLLIYPDGQDKPFFHGKIEVYVNEKPAPYIFRINARQKK